jgi:hypothetical protein
VFPVVTHQIIGVTVQEYETPPLAVIFTVHGIISIPAGIRSATDIFPVTHSETGTLTT